MLPCLFEKQSVSPALYSRIRSLNRNCRAGTASVCPAKHKALGSARKPHCTREAPATIAMATAGAGQGPKQAVVVGAGPAGALAAMFLAREGYAVEVFEQRGAPLEGAQPSIGPRSYNILLTERAAAALDDAGADLSGFDVPSAQALKRHKLRGAPGEGRTMQAEGRLRLANRGVLAGALVQQCRDRHGGSIRFHFGQALHSLDAAKRTATFLPAAAGATAAEPSRAPAPAAAVAAQGGDAGSGVEGFMDPCAAGQLEACAQERLAEAARRDGTGAGARTVSFDLLVGADGAGSRVREALVHQDPGMRVSQTRDVMEFRTCVLGPAQEFLPAGTSPVGTFQTWSNSKLQATLIGSSTGDGQLRCVFILPEGVHATLKTAADYEAYLRRAIPSLPEDAVKRVAPQLVESPISNGGMLTRCSKLHSGPVALVGDAAHSVYPALGQGANAALEGAAAFGAVLRELGPAAGAEAVGAEYSRRWLPNALAVVDLTEEGFGGNSRAFALNLKLAQLITQMTLHKLLPFLVPKPAFFQLNSTTIPYSVCLERGRQELRVFKGVLAALAVALLAVVCRRLLGSP